jgi:hypothetical protein
MSDELDIIRPTPNMTPLEYALWLNGAASLVDEAPTPEQWAKIREKLADVMGGLVAMKLLENARVLSEEQERKRRATEELYKLRAASIQSLGAQYAQRIDQMMVDALSAPDPVLKYQQQVAEFEAKNKYYEMQMRKRRVEADMFAKTLAPPKTLLGAPAGVVGIPKMISTPPEPSAFQDFIQQIRKK